MIRKYIFLILLGSLLPLNALAWNERGHDLVTRSAVRILIHKNPEHALTLNALFGRKEHMLSHLSNVPDIVWRNLSPEISSQGAATHFFDVEYVLTKPSFDSFPASLKEAKQLAQAICQQKEDSTFSESCISTNRLEEFAKHIGSAPWRITQLYEKVVSTMKARNPDQALVYAGLLSHFVGDLTNPLHTTRDYDGYEHDQGGLHAYFESDILNAYEFDLDQEVLESAMRHQPFSQLRKKYRFAQSSFPIAKALLLESHSRLSSLFNLDKKFALKKPSSNKNGLKLAAERRPSHEVCADFRSFMIDELSLAADTLAELWFLAWSDAGKPDFSDFQSYQYDVAPAYLAPDYFEPKDSGQ